MPATNPVGTWVLPDADTQDATSYKTHIENCFAVAQRLSNAFAPHQQSSPNMTVRVEGGFIYDAVTRTLTEVAAQSTGTINKPSSNPRIDRVVVDATTGSVSVITGSEASSPSPPSITAGKIPIAQVYLTPTMPSQITNQIIFDERIGTIGVYVPKTIVVPHTWAIPGDIRVPSGDQDYIVPFFVPVPTGQSVKLIKSRHVIKSGTSATVKLQKNDSDISGWTGIIVTTTATTTAGGDVSLSDNDRLALVVTAVSGAPKHLTFTLYLQYAV